MGVLADWQIEQEGIITPFAQAQKVPGIISYGVSSYGYDLRAGTKFHVFSPVKGAGGVIDPKNFRSDYLEMVTGDCVIPPNSFALAYTLERVAVPRDCIGIVLGKSTLARCAQVINCTPLEPEWRGHVTMEISNTAPLPVKVYAGEGIAQVLFLRADGVTLALYDMIRSLLSPHAKGDERVCSMTDQRIRAVVRDFLCRQSYADKAGRYQDQKEAVTLPCVHGQPPTA